MDKLIQGVWICALVTLLVTPVRAEFIDIYSIGNSLTVDLSALVLDQLSENEADPLHVGFHAKCGASLTSILESPTFCLASDKFGQFPNALSNNQFYAVTLQPYNGSTIRQEVEAARQMVIQLRANPNNANTRVLIFATWSQNFVNQPFETIWNSTGANLDSPFVPTAEVYDIFMNELKITVPEAELLPVGHVFNALSPKIAQGLLPGISSISDLYRDVDHASSTGRYVADLAAYAAIYKKSPEGLGLPSLFTQGTGPFMTDPAARLVAQQVTWETVQTFIAVPESHSSLDFVLLSFVGLAAWNALGRTRSIRLSIPTAV